MSLENKTKGELLELVNKRDSEITEIIKDVESILYNLETLNDDSLAVYELKKLIERLN